MKVVKKIFVVTAVAVCTVFASQALAARPSVYFKAPVKFRGTGCPKGTITVDGANTDTLTVMFGGYDAAKPSSEAVSKLRRSACSFSVPVHVPKGFQVSAMTADWRGYAEGKTKLFREYFFAGQRGPRKTTSPKGEFRERDNLMHATWSPCSQRDVPMRINSSVMARSRGSYIAVDTIDLKNKIIFHLKSRRCR